MIKDKKITFTDNKGFIPPFKVKETPKEVETEKLVINMTDVVESSKETEEITYQKPELTTAERKLIPDNIKQKHAKIAKKITAALIGPLIQLEEADKALWHESGSKTKSIADKPSDWNMAIPKEVKEPVTEDFRLMVENINRVKELGKISQFSNVPASSVKVSVRMPNDDGYNFSTQGLIVNTALRTNRI